MVRLVGGVAEGRDGGGSMVAGGDGSGDVWGAGGDSRRRLRGGGLIPSEEAIFSREVRSRRSGMINNCFLFNVYSAL